MWGVAGTASTGNRRRSVRGVRFFSGSIRILYGFVLVLRTEIRRKGFSHPAGLVLLFSFLPTACTVGCILSPLRRWEHVDARSEIGDWGLRMGSVSCVASHLFQGLTARLKPCPSTTPTAENFSASCDALSTQRFSAASEADSPNLFQGRRGSVVGIYWGDGAAASGLGTSGWGASDLGAAGCRPRASKVRVFASP